MKRLSFAVLLLCLTAFTAQAQPPGMGRTELSFAQEVFDFNIQMLRTPNCINIPLVNFSDRVRTVTAIKTGDSAYSISSPAEEMMPMEMQPGQTVYINVCFRPTEVKPYYSKVVAYFGGDSAVLRVNGGGARLEPQAVPKEYALRVRNANAPNEYSIEVDLANMTPIKLVVSNALGIPIKSFTMGEPRAAGMHLFQFNGRDSDGKSLEPGKYYVKLEAMDFKETKTIEIKPRATRAKK